MKQQKFTTVQKRNGIVNTFDTSYSPATTSADGLMSAVDKMNLGSIDEAMSFLCAFGNIVEANNYTHPSYTARTSGLYKITVDSSGHISEVTAATEADITALDIVNTLATTSSAGLMSASDKERLDMLYAQVTALMQSGILVVDSPTSSATEES